MLPIESPYPQFFDLDGSPLDAGYIYIGEQNQNPETSPVVVYWDEALTLPAPQPLRTLNGMISNSGTPAFVYAAADYSMMVRNSRMEQVVYVLSSVSFVSPGWSDALRSELAAPTGGEMIGHRYSNPGRRTTASKELRELRRDAIQLVRPAIQPIPYVLAALRDDSDYSIVCNGNVSDRYQHSPRVERDIAGRLHLVYSRGLLHGYGGLVPPNAIDPQGQIIYRYSDDEGRTWSTEQIVCVALPPDPLNVFRTVFDCHVGVCPSGRLVIVVSDIPPPSAQWGVPTGSTKYRWFINDNRGELDGGGGITWIDKGVFFTAFNDFARVYCERVKQVPKAGGGFRMAFADYRKVNAGTDLVRSYWTSDDEFETAPIQYGLISNQESAANETDFTMVDAELGFAIARGTGTMHITRDGGQTWTKFSDSSNYTRQLWEAGGLVAPVIDTVWQGGKPFVLLGYSHRGAGPDGPRWLVSSVGDLFALENAVVLGQQFTPWGINYFSGPTVSGPGGYNSGIVYDDGGLMYVDCTETTVSPTTGKMRSDVRIVRTNATPWFPDYGGLMIGSNVSTFTQYNNNEVPFVPRLEGSTAAGTPSYSSAVGYNVRMGHLAFVDAEMIVNAYTGITGTLSIKGLPFAPRTIGFNPCSLDVKVVNALAAGFPASEQVMALFLPGTNQIQLYRKANNGNLVALQLSDLGAAFNVRISGHYLCLNEGLS